MHNSGLHVDEILHFDEVSAKTKNGALNDSLVA